MEDTSRFMRNAMRVDIDNHLSMLYHRIIDDRIYTFPFERSLTYSGITMGGIETDKVTIVKNLLQKDLAVRVRDFIYAIPIDFNEKQINDSDVKPRDSIFSSLECSREERDKIVVAAYEKRRSDPKGWKWEKYSHVAWRLTPLTLEDFIGSPIYELIYNMYIRWWRSDMEINEKSPWQLMTIQRTIDSMDKHTDKSSSIRKVAFLYYITPDDFDYNIDGGELNLHRSRDIKINPEFNSLVCWNMHGDRYITHSVESVKSDKIRIVAVGFLNE